MGLFDKLFKVDKGKARELKLSKEEAFLGIALSSVAADEVIAPEEVLAMNYTLIRMRAFRDLNPAQVSDMLNRFTHIIRREGAGTVIEAAKSSLDAKMKETAFAVAVDLVLADGVVEAKEKEFLEKLQKAIGIPDELATKIVEVLIIKNRGAGQDWFDTNDKSKPLYG
jgi:tellurite resistance protein